MSDNCALSYRCLPIGQGASQGDCGGGCSVEPEEVGDQPGIAQQDAEVVDDQQQEAGQQQAIADQPMMVRV